MQHASRKGKLRLPYQQPARRWSGPSASEA